MNKQLEQLAEKAKVNHKANKKFFAKLKKRPPKQLDGLMQELHADEFTRTDCLECANCCKTLPALMSKRDIKRIAKHLSMSRKSFQDKYVREDEDGDIVIDGAPCPFLQEDNKCSIYEVRPASCKQYPHSGGHQFYDLIELHRKNINHCPALYEIVETLGDRYLLFYKACFSHQIHQAVNIWIIQSQFTF